MWVVGEHVVIIFVKQKVTIATAEKSFILAFRTNILKAARRNILFYYGVLINRIRMQLLAKLKKRL